MGEKVDFKRAYFIKLGRGGVWEESSISESKLRIGYGGQSLQDINSGNWGKIGEQLSQASKGKKGVATKDLKALRLICESTSEALWITFFQGTMWWCKLGAREILQDNTSKYRLVDGKWSNKDVDEYEQLDINSIPGVISKIRGFRGTVCKVLPLEYLRRLVNVQPGPEYKRIKECNTELVQSVEKGIRVLNPKDFETFVDLVFRESGWRRLSPKGETMKSIDLELEDPITKERYQVQIKTGATFEDFERYAKQFNPQHPIRWLYFVVHSPDEKLMELRNPDPWPNVKLIGPSQLSEMVVRLGLTDWLMSHIK
ncbi:MAG: hypothetical protein Q7T57_01210 [Dehalococcoidales bacterium]|nr:hypothetical protein [Dehalococcoidales bacterium]